MERIVNRAVKKDASPVPRAHTFPDAQIPHRNHAEPAIEACRESNVMTSVVERFVDESLGGSVSPFIAYLAKSRGLSEIEVAQLRQLVRKLEDAHPEEN